MIETHLVPLFAECNALILLRVCLLVFSIGDIFGHLRFIILFERRQEHDRLRISGL